METKLELYLHELIIIEERVPQRETIFFFLKDLSEAS